jgi:hypothetical protein
MKGNNMILKITGVITLIGSMGAGIWSVDTRYAKQNDLILHAQAHSEERREVKREILETRRALLETQLYDLEIAKEKRQLTPLERQRHEALKTEISRLEETIRFLGGR